MALLSPSPAPALEAVPSPPDTPVEPATPDWVQEAREKYSLRLRDYLAQAWDFTLHPVRTARQWVRREREFLNPLRFLAVGFAFAVAFRHAGENLLLGPPRTDALLAALLSKPWATQLMVVLLALVTHPWIRLLGSKAPLRASIGIAVFAFAGPGVLLEIAGWTISSLWGAFGTVHLASLTPAAGADAAGQLHYSHYPLPVVVVSYASFLWMIGAVAGVHQLRWWKSVLALLAGYITIIILAGVGMLLAMGVGGL